MGTIHQARPAAVAHFASSSAGMSFRTAISTTAGAAQVLALYNHRLAEADFVMLAVSATPSAWPRRSCFRARRRGHHARVPCPNYQPSSGQLCMLDQNTRKSCSNGRKTLGKQLTGW
jgi:hypothetical protein